MRTEGMLLLAAGLTLVAAGRLENTYLPPYAAEQAGGLDLALPALRQPQRHTETAVLPLNSYLPPVNSVVVEAKLQQPPKPLGNVGILRQQGLQSTLGYGSPTPLLPPQQAFTQAKFDLQGLQSQQGLQDLQSLRGLQGQQQVRLSATPFLTLRKQQTATFIPPRTTTNFAFPMTHLNALSSSFTSQQPSQNALAPSLASQSAASVFSAKTTTSLLGSQQLQPSPFSAGVGLRQQSVLPSSVLSGQPIAPVAILRSVSVNNGDGRYSYRYETENGIQAQEQGELRQTDVGEAATTVQGGFAFTAPDTGARYSVTYTADENGFRALGDHLPTPPPIPEAILRSIEQNAREEQQAYQRAREQQNYQQGLPQVIQRQGYQSPNLEQGYQPSSLGQRQRYQPSLRQPYQQGSQLQDTSSFDATRGGYRY